jgi:NAD(P)-dependent dehydrogenase (short-subunit alcohol dehydrogenase family)
MNSSKSAIIIGASKGIGLAIVEKLLERGWMVVATCRQGAPGQLSALAERFPKALEIEALDITKVEEISAFKSRVSNKTFDLLFVNAGTATADSVLEVSTEEFMRVMVTNSISPIRVVEHLADRVRPGGTIGIMSSGQGSIADNENGVAPVYRASKAALNMFMKGFAARRGKEYALLLLAPGWIKTDLGGPGARFTIEETIDDIVDTIIAQDGKKGLEYLDRFGKAVRW